MVFRNQDLGTRCAQWMVPAPRYSQWTELKISIYWTISSPWDLLILFWYKIHSCFLLFHIYNFLDNKIPGSNYPQYVHYLINPPPPPYNQSPIFFFKLGNQHHFLGGHSPPLHQHLFTPLGLQHPVLGHCCPLPICVGHIPLGHCRFSHSHCRHHVIQFHLMTVGLNCLREGGAQGPPQIMATEPAECLKQGIFSERIFCPGVTVTNYLFAKILCCQVYLRLFIASWLGTEIPVEHPVLETSLYHLVSAQAGELTTWVSDTKGACNLTDGGKFFGYLGSFCWLGMQVPWFPYTYQLELALPPFALFRWRTFSDVHMPSVLLVCSGCYNKIAWTE